MHARIALVILIATSPALTGCIDAAATAIDQARTSVGMPPQEISAKSAAEAAWERARAWDEDALLHQAFAVESASGAPHYNHRGGPDPDVGNGRATAWTFEFVTPERRLELVVHANRTVTDVEHDANGNPEDYEDARRAGSWKVDSDTAMRRLQKDSVWQEKTSERNGTDVTVALGVDAEDNRLRLVWAFFAMDAHGSGVVGIVDATSGDLVGVYAWDGFDWDGWARSWKGCCGEWSFERSDVTYEDSFAGELTALTPTRSVEFPVAAAGQPVHLELSVRGSSEIGGITVAVTDPDGRDVQVEVTSTEEYPASRAVEYLAVATAPGTHTVSLTLEFPDAYAIYVARIAVGGEPNSRYMR